MRPSLQPGAASILLMERPLTDIPSEIQLHDWKVPMLGAQADVAGPFLSGNKSRLEVALTVSCERRG